MVYFRQIYREEGFPGLYRVSQVPHVGWVCVCVCVCVCVGGWVWGVGVGVGGWVRVGGVSVTLILKV